MSRWRVTFWLDDQIDRDWKIGEMIRDLKKQRQFTSAVRDGIRLIVDLRAGRTDVLFELFPLLAEQLKASAAPPPPDTSGLERKIDQLQQAFLSGGAGSSNGLSMLPATTGGLIGGGIKTMNVPQIAMPTFDDDDDEQDTVVIKRADPAEVSKNWVEQMFKSVQQLADAPVSADAKLMTAPREMNKRARSETDDDNLIVKRAVAQ